MERQKCRDFMWLRPCVCLQEVRLSFNMVEQVKTTGFFYDTVFNKNTISDIV